MPVTKKIKHKGENGVITDYDIGALSTNVTMANGQSLETIMGNKVDKAAGKGLSTNDYTTAEKNKLSGIETGANKTTVDAALSSTSENPVQNKVINGAINNKVDRTNGEVINNLSVKSSDWLTTGDIGSDASGNVVFGAFDGIDYNYQHITLNPINGTMPKFTKGCQLTGEEAEGDFYTELNPQIQIGTYSGNGSPKQNINLGKRPKFVYVSPMNGVTTKYANTTLQIYGGLALDGHSLREGSVPAVEITNTGFTVDQDDNYTNQAGTTYYYIWG